MPSDPQQLDKAAGRLVALAIVLVVLSLLGFTALVAILRFGSMWGLLLLAFGLPAALVISAIAFKALAQRRRSGLQRQ